VSSILPTVLWTIQYALSSSHRPTLPWDEADYSCSLYAQLNSSVFRNRSDQTDTNIYWQTSKQKSCTSPTSGNRPSSLVIEAGIRKSSFLSVTRSRKKRSNLSRESLSVTAAKDHGIANNSTPCWHTAVMLHIVCVFADGINCIHFINFSCHCLLGKQLLILKCYVCTFWLL